MSAEVRAARAGDAGAIAALHVVAWRTAYAGILPAPVLTGLSVDEHTEQWADRLSEGQAHVWVAVAPDIEGFVAAGDSRDEDLAGTGELHALYVAPARWRRGHGALLLAAASTWLSERYPTAHLWVLASNQRGRQFYISQGWRPDGAEKVENFGEVAVPEVRLAVRFRRPSWLPRLDPQDAGAGPR